ncbi:MAG: hypothetical protein HY812_21935 [Planctomycetes bacterium]|nr:hypothetical protein [Planctomycetota bacterium]
MRRPRLHALVLALLLCAWHGAALSRTPQDPAPSGARKETDPRLPALEAGRKALAQGDAAAAVKHLRNALWFQPFAPDALALLLEAEARDANRRTLWAHALAAACADEKGMFRPSREVRSLLTEDDPFLERLPATRAQAVAEVAAWANRLERAPGATSHGDPILARFLRSLAFAALKRLMTDALGNGRSGEAIEAARCLIGLAAQAGFKDLKGPRPPDLAQVREQAHAALSGARERLRAEQGEPLSIARLEEMSTEERVEFTRAHCSFACPGVALSETGRYRIETSCGHGTLLGAAETIELHHARLVSFFGQDPFAERPGLVRIVPEAEELEAEATPFWWAGGFQSGDVTTLRFSAGTVPGLGRGLTHELTHRFDGALFPGLPGWLLEGRAVYTGAAYGQMREESFIPNHAVFGTIEQTMRKGYGGLDKLTQLIEGTIDDYRDNYVAGYALFIYLNTWEENGALLFRERLGRFMAQAAKNRMGPKAWFEDCFSDGKGGRPKDLTEFAERFNDFICGFYWLDRKPWTDRYTEETWTEAQFPVYDFPTWQFSRNRAEPWFGQGQAARAGELLLSSGRLAEAADALVWAFELDEWSAARGDLLAGVLERLREERPAWVLKNENRLRAPRLGLPHPGPSPLAPSLPRVAAHLKALREAALHYRAAGQDLAAAALGADHDRLAERLGLARLEGAPALDERELRPPFETAARSAGHLGWFEEELTGYEEFRVANLWYDSGEGSLHVGRAAPRDATGQLDRTAHLQHAFARGGEWLAPGRYRLHTRIHFTTTYVDGAVIVGWTRRDRNVRFEFSAGDYMYSIGQKEEAAELDSIAASLHGIRDGESAGTGQTIATGVHFEQPATSFALELLVDGPEVLAFVNGELLGTYHAADAQPVEGYVGFASSFGAFRAEAPTFEPLYRQATAGVIDERTIGLSPAARGPVERRDLINRPVAGFPLSPGGTVAVWIPGPTAEDLASLAGEEELAFERRRRAYIASRSARSAAELLWRDGFSRSLVLVLPDFLGADDLRVLDEALRAEPPVQCTIITHHKQADLIQREGEIPVTGMQVILFVDALGVLRALMPFKSDMTVIPGELDYWLRIYRGRERRP